MSSLTRKELINAQKYIYSTCKGVFSFSDLYVKIKKMSCGIPLVTHETIQQEAIFFARWALEYKKENNCSNDEFKLTWQAWLASKRLNK